MEKKKTTVKEEGAKIASALITGGCEDKNCPVHGSLKARGRVFEGIVAKKFPSRLVMGFDRTIYVRKYERYKKSRTKIHARLPKCMHDQIEIGDTVRVQECRPLSKIIHFVVIKKIKDAPNQKGKAQEEKK